MAENTGETRYALTGRVVDVATLSAVSGVRVEAHDLERLSPYLVAVAFTDALGDFRMGVTPAYLDSVLKGRHSGLVLRVFRGARQLLVRGSSSAEVEGGCGGGGTRTDSCCSCGSTECRNGGSGEPTWVPSREPSSVELAVSADATGRMKPAKRTILGRLTDSTGKGLPGYLVRYFGVTATGESAAGSALTTDVQGRFTSTLKISVANLAKAAERPTPNLVFRAFAPITGEEVANVTVWRAPTVVLVALVSGGAELQAPCEYDQLLEAVVAVADGLDIGALTEEQVTFVAQAADQALERVHLLVSATSQAEQVQAIAAGFPPQLVYALSRRGLQVNTQLFTRRVDTLVEEIAAAADDNIIHWPPELSKEDARALWAEWLGEIAVWLALDTSGDGRSVAEHLDIVLTSDPERQTFFRTYAHHKGTPAEFWAALSLLPGFTETATIERLQRVLQWGALARYHKPLALELDARFTAGTEASVSDLAKLDVEGWKSILTDVGVPADMPGADAEEKKANYAQLLAASIEMAFPTHVIANRLSQEPGASPDIELFFSANPDFRFGRTRLAAYLASHDNALQGSVDPEGTIRTLKKVERLQKVAPRAEHLTFLAQAGFESSKHIVQYGRRRFISKHAEDLGGADNAARIFNRARAVRAKSMALFGKFSAQLNSLSGPVLPDWSTSLVAGSSVGAAAALRTGDGNLADWRTLFGQVDYCACEHCKSVLGPAAYLVDLLEFLEQQGSETPDKSARSVLLERRPDIANLMLSCENTNTALPYIDLVNEILEFSIASLSPPDYAIDHIDTVGTTPELLAAPEVKSEDAHLEAYVTLAAAVHPFHLPFNVWHEEAKIYLEHLGVSHDDLLEALVEGTDLAAGEADYLSEPFGIVEARAAAKLGITKLDWQIITGVAIPGADIESYWGLRPLVSSSSPPCHGDPVALQKVRVFLKHAGIEYDELRELLATQYLQVENLTLSPDAGCDLEEKCLLGLAENEYRALSRIHRFLRLQRKTGWKITELDKAIVALSSGIEAPWDISRDLLVRLAAVQELQTDLPVPILTVLSWFADMDTVSSLEWGTSLYEDVFLNKSVSNPPDEAFRRLVLGGESPPPLLVEHAGVIRAGLQLVADEFSLLTDSGSAATIGLAPVLATDALLTLANLSRLHRIATFARALKLSVSDVLVMQALSGMNVLAGDDEAPAEPSTTLAFIDLIKKIRSSGFSAAELQFVLRHVFVQTSGVAPGQDALDQIDAELDAGIDAVVKETTFEPDPTGARTRTVLTELLTAQTFDDAGIDPPDDLAAKPDAIMAALGGTSPASVEAQPESIEAQEELIELLAWAFDGEDIEGAKDLLVDDGLGSPPRPGLETAAQRFDYLLIRLLNFSRVRKSKTLIVQKLATAMKLEEQTVGHFLSNVLAAITVGNSAAIEDFLPKSNLGVDEGTSPPGPPDPPYRAPSVEADRTQQILLLYKIAVIVRRFKARPVELEYLYPQLSPPAAWLDLGSLPISPETAAQLPEARVRFAGLVRLMDLFSLRNKLPAGKTALFELFAIAVTSSPTSMETFLDEVSARTKWDRADLGYLAADVFRLDSMSAFTDEVALSKLLRAFSVLKRLGASSGEARRWAFGPAIPPVDAARVASEVKRAARARHTEAEWSDVARPLRDVLRDKQRAALVGHLLTQNDLLLKGPNALFARHLLDVEMSPCQLTSRIKFAISSVQTFVQRCLLNLEDEVRLDSEAATEWKWRKVYRVWEANRKVFLYPENWIEPELRDDKSPFFKALETRLMQSDVTAGAAEDAFREYLTKLDEVAKLDIVAMYHQEEDKTSEREAIDVLHVIGRTNATPARYFYRRQIDSGAWTPWLNIDLEVEGDHVVTAVFARRLYLIWGLFEPAADEPDDSDITQKATPTKPEQYYQLRLAWSEYKNGRWSPKRVTRSTLAVRGKLKSGSLWGPSAYTLTAEPEGSALRVRCIRVTTVIGYFDLGFGETPRAVTSSETVEASFALQHNADAQDSSSYPSPQSLELHNDYGDIEVILSDSEAHTLNANELVARWYDYPKGSAIRHFFYKDADRVFQVRYVGVPERHEPAKNAVQIAVPDFTAEAAFEPPWIKIIQLSEDYGYPVTTTSLYGFTGAPSTEKYYTGATYGQ